MRGIMLLGAVLMCAQVSAAEKLSSLSAEEWDLFKGIAKVYPDFHYSREVRRHYAENPGSGQAQEILAEMVFVPKDDLLFDEYLSYHVSFSPDSKIVRYSFDAGTAFRGEGVIVSAPEHIIRTEFSCGTGGCATTVYDNGAAIYTAE